MSARAPRRILAGILGLSLLVGVGLAPAAQSTDAAWSDSEFAASSTLRAATLQAPIIDGYNSCFGLLGLGTLVIRWHWPNEAPYTGLNGTSNVEWSFNGGDWVAGVTSVSQGGGAYTTTFAKGLLPALTDILVALLTGGSVEFRARTSAGTEWRSPQSAKALKYSSGVLAGSCSVV